MVRDTETIRQLLPKNRLSVFDHFGRLMLKELIEFAYFFIYKSKEKCFSFSNVTKDILVCVVNSDVSVLQILSIAQRPMGGASANQDSLGRIVQKVYRMITY